ncbi:MAG: uroporphyrinogen decarboxylase family protein [Anaerolineae bacterium]|nr:uroporphyrinogen decarboxylase family protein [Anaerolineae bacterium]
MNPRERIRAAIEHRRPDRVPLDLGGTSVTGIVATACARLRDALGLEPLPPRVFDPFLMLAEVEDDLRLLLGIDTVPLRLPTNRFGIRNAGWKPWRLWDGTEVMVAGGFNVTEAENGDLLAYPGGDTTLAPSARMPKGGYYFDAILRQEPIDEDHLDPDEWVQGMFSVYSEEDLRYLEARADYLYRNTDWSIVGHLAGGAFGDISHVPAVGLPHPKGIRDPLEWYVAHVTHPEYIRGIFERQCQVALQNLHLLWQAVGQRMDVIYISGTDFGTQGGSFISPDLYRDLYKPFHKRLNDWIHAHTTWKAFYHSCGSIVELLDDLVDAGVDIINPVQTSARGMDPAILKARYGGRLVFWGGGVDTQWTLPFGTPAQVYQEAWERIRIFCEGGGYVFNPVHNIQENVPAENMLAMFQAVVDAGALVG